LARPPCAPGFFSSNKPVHQRWRGGLATDNQTTQKIAVSHQSDINDHGSDSFLFCNP
jgi:hypothetical protein